MLVSQDLFDTALYEFDPCYQELFVHRCHYCHLTVDRTLPQIVEWLGIGTEQQG